MTLAATSWGAPLPVGAVAGDGWWFSTKAATPPYDLLTAADSGHCCKAPPDALEQAEGSSLPFRSCHRPRGHELPHADHGDPHAGDQRLVTAEWS